MAKKDYRFRLDNSEKAIETRFRFLVGVLVFVTIIMLYLIVRINLVTREMKAINEANLAVEEMSASAVRVASEVETEEDEAGKVPIPSLEDLPLVNLSDWQYVLVNKWHPIDEKFVPSTAQLENVEIDARIYDILNKFVSDARSNNLNVCISSGYRSYATQTMLFENDTQSYGEEKAEKTLSHPGESEHQTGLATDLTDKYYEYKDASIEKTETYKWLLAHCHEYGFILRYPKGKEAITGIDYEPWHFRYVGVEVATYIMKNNLAYEEFVNIYRANAMFNNVIAKLQQI